MSDLNIYEFSCLYDVLIYLPICIYAYLCICIIYIYIYIYIYIVVKCQIKSPHLLVCVLYKYKCLILFNIFFLSESIHSYVMIF